MSYAPPMDLDALLTRAVALGATDIHLKVDRPPVVRLDGALRPMNDMPMLGDHDLASVLERVTSHSQERLRSFRDEGDLDIAYSTAGLPRFRVNGYRQRGSTSFAFRVIPKQVPTFEELSLPPGVRTLA